MSKKKKIIIGISVPVCLFIFVFMTMYTEYAWMCSVCGSQKHETQWFFGATTGKGLDHTKLEDWIVEKQGFHEHNWCSVAGTGHNIFGQSTIHSHGRAPEIHSFARRGFTDDILTYLSSEDIDHFVKTMTDGTREEQESLSKEVSDKIMEEKYGI